MEIVKKIVVSKEPVIETGGDYKVYSLSIETINKILDWRDPDIKWLNEFQRTTVRLYAEYHLPIYVGVTFHENGKVRSLFICGDLELMKKEMERRVEEENMAAYTWVWDHD